MEETYLQTRSLIYNKGDENVCIFGELFENECFIAKL